MYNKISLKLVFINFGYIATAFATLGFKLMEYKREYRNTVGEIIIATIKRRNNFWYPLKLVIIPILR